MYLKYSFKIISFFIFILQTMRIHSYKIEVKVSQGKIIGTRQATVFEGKLYYAFYGIPYAQTPIGKLRFKNPKPLKKWKKPYDASTEYHGACAQAHIVHKPALYGFENCLNMNIYSPHLPNNLHQKLKPVIVWIHGYAFASSFSHVYGADFLIDNDILFISVTHRIGVFGFLKVNDTDINVNMGLKDIVFALKWISKNIHNFGGDKNQITVMGNGSAATYLSLLLMTKFKTLFSKMILQSGAIFSPSIFQGDYKVQRERFMKELKKITSKDVFTASTKDIINAAKKIYSSREIMDFQRSVVPFTPIIEKQSNKSLLTKRPIEFYNTVKKLNISILIGFNSQESISEVIPFLHNPRYLKAFATYFKFMVPFSDGCSYSYSSDIYNEIAMKIKNKYFEDEISENSIHKFLRYASDLHIHPVIKFIKTQLRIKEGNMYVYKFNYVGKFNAMKATSISQTNIHVKGASSGDEICYILKCEPYWENYVKLNRNFYDRDRLFIKYIARMWANFAKTGKPTPLSQSENVTWPQMTVENDKMLLISKQSKVINTVLENRMFLFWEDLYNKYFKNEYCTPNIRDEL
ncbi:juvenile hormone esterase-like [Galleria mellonella]|uniref:Juvenile hormone esterase-like n=1 Tax=Galleria mellonella TaxID=7137 RepID=A0ABM3MMP4_GALME|nr:juvenile hormone esterase-like [Galleria mellonella]